MTPLAAGILAGGSLLGSLFGSKKSKQPETETTNEPWEGIQPYLIGKDVPAWARDPYVGQGVPQQNWLDYIASLGAGNYLTPQGQVIQPPPAFANDPRSVGPDWAAAQQPAAPPPAPAPAPAAPSFDPALAKLFQTYHIGTTMGQTEGSSGVGGLAQYAMRQSGIDPQDFVRQYDAYMADLDVRNRAQGLY